jgi:hypothetical protein
MWTRQRPFAGLHDYAIVIKVYKGLRPERPSSSLYNDEKLPDRLWDFIQRCWSQDPRTRPPMEEVVEFMQSSISSLSRLVI